MSAPASPFHAHRHRHGPEQRRRWLVVVTATLAFHAIVLVVLGSIRIYEYVREENAQFESPIPPPQAIPPEVLEYKVRMEQRQAESSRPQLRRLEVQPIPDRALPELSVSLPPPGTGPSLRGQGQGSGSGDGLGVGRGLGFGAVAVNPRAFGTTRQLEHSWVGTIYFFTNLERLRTPDGRWFEGANREMGRRRLYTYLLNVPKQSFTEGFPGISNQFEWFAIDFTADIYWPEYAAGEWEFRVSSDDGSIFQVNGLDVIDHDGQHGFDSREGRVTLNPGRVQFRLAYFQGPRTELGLILEWRRPGQSEWKLFDLREFLPYQKR